MLVDTSGLLAAMDRDAAEHAACLAAIENARGRLLLSPFVLAELDSLITARLGQDLALMLLDDVAAGAYQLEPMSAVDVAGAAGVMRRHLDFVGGLADASIVALAERHGTGEVLTLDHRHFRVLTWSDGRAFRVLPADS